MPAKAETKDTVPKAAIQPRVRQGEGRDRWIVLLGVSFGLLRRPTVELTGLRWLTPRATIHSPTKNKSWARRVDIPLCLV
ncbi:MAG: hypothetical protein P3X23_004430 [Thermosynechococcus sp. Uc]|nr:hypothetical protein [Thermosynechococcus sp. Uc]